MSDEDKKELTAEEAHKRAAEVNQARVNERIAQMELIADNAEKGRPDDIDGVEKEDEATRTERLAAEETAAAEAEALRLQQEGAPEKEDDSDTKTVNGEVYYRQIVNGHEKWQSIKQIRDAAQKVESADEYLHQASESVKTASRLALSKDEPASLGEDEVRKLLAAVALGDEDAINRLASHLSKPSDTSDVLQKIDQRLSFRTELAQLESEQKEILDDPMLGELFASRLNKLKAEAPQTPLAVAYRSIGKEIRDRFGIALKGSTAEKLERKRTLPQVPSAAARQHAEAEDEGEEDPSMTIEKMAKARGYTPHVHTRRQ